jgi:hypothetical protein
MGVLVALVVGMVIWVTGWSLTGNGFDFFMITILLVVMAAAARIARPFVQQLLGNDTYLDKRES